MDYDDTAPLVEALLLPALLRSQKIAVAGAFAQALSLGHTLEFYVWAESFYEDLCLRQLELSHSDWHGLSPLLGLPPEYEANGLRIDPFAASDAHSQHSSSSSSSSDAMRSNPFLSVIHPSATTRWQILVNLLVGVLRHDFASKRCYDARTRAVFRSVAHAFGVDWRACGEIEDAIANQLRELQQHEKTAAGVAAAASAHGGGDGRSLATNHVPPSSSSGSTTQTRRKGSALSSALRWAKVGLAAATGATLLVLTGGLAAPALIAGVGIVGGALGMGAVTGALGAFFSTAGGATLLLSLFGIGGGSLASYKMAKRTAGVSVFQFVPLAAADADAATDGDGDDGRSERQNEAERETSAHDAPPLAVAPGLHVFITISGLVTHAGTSDFSDPWGGLSQRPSHDAPIDFDSAADSDTNVNSSGVGEAGSISVTRDSNTVNSSGAGEVDSAASACGGPVSAGRRVTSNLHKETQRQQQQQQQQSKCDDGDGFSDDGLDDEDDVNYAASADGDCVNDASTDNHGVVSYVHSAAATRGILAASTGVVSTSSAAWPWDADSRLPALPPPTQLQLAASARDDGSEPEPECGPLRPVTGLQLESGRRFNPADYEFRRPSSRAVQINSSSSSNNSSTRSSNSDRIDEHGVELIHMSSSQSPSFFADQSRKATAAEELDTGSSSSASDASSSSSSSSSFSVTLRPNWFRSMFPYGEPFALIVDPDEFRALGRLVSEFISDYLKNSAISYALTHTVLATVLAAWTLPSYVVSALSFIDAPWAVAMARADSAGLALADALERRAQGRRPVTLIGWGLGARIAFRAVEELARRADAAAAGSAAEGIESRNAPSAVVYDDAVGDSDFGDVAAHSTPSNSSSTAPTRERTPSSSAASTARMRTARALAHTPQSALILDLVLLGAPVPAASASWLRVRSVVAGRVINGCVHFNSNDGHSCALLAVTGKLRLLPLHAELKNVPLFHPHTYRYCTRDFVLSYLYRSYHGVWHVAGVGCVHDKGASQSSSSLASRESASGYLNTTTHDKGASQSSSLLSRETSNEYSRSSATTGPIRSTVNGSSSSSSGSHRGTTATSSDSSGENAAAPAPVALSPSNRAPPSLRSQWYRGIESIDLTAIVSGHTDYANKLPEVLSVIGLERH